MLQVQLRNSRWHNMIASLLTLIRLKLYLCSCLSVTGSCFFIFSSALKPSGGYLAKSSIVEGRTSAKKRRFIISNILLAGNSLLRFSKVYHSCLKNGFIQSLLVFVCVCLCTFKRCLCRSVCMLTHVSVRVSPCWSLFVCFCCIAFPSFQMGLWCRSPWKPWGRSAGRSGK